MEHIRQLRVDEIEACIMLAAAAFQVELTDEMIAARVRIIDPDTVWGLFIDDVLVSKLTIHPLHTYMNGKALSMGGIAAVATLPEYQHKGFAGRLIRHSLKVMREQGHLLSFLAPFSFGFYRKYGWETIADYKEYELDCAILGEWGQVDGSVVKALDVHWDELRQVYESYAQRYNGMLRRGEKWWSNHLFFYKKGEVDVFLNPAGEMEGYIFYEMKPGNVNVHEIVSLNENARKGLLAHIAFRVDQACKLTMRVPVDDRLPFLFVEHSVDQKQKAYFMGRIIDVQRFLERYPYAVAPPGTSVCFRIDDPVVEWNNGQYTLQIGADHIPVVSQCRDSGDRIAQCSVNTLVALTSGYVNAAFLQSAGLLQADEGTIEILDQLFNGKTAYIFDYF